jgi:hypothetical protein
MSNPTTPFSWQMPTNTDLVTDLPADFEVFGQAVATSMADLLGGTTGQVLSKTTNADMDFTWVNQDDSNAIQNAIVDAKGDLIAATAADTPARLAVGTNGQILTADSTASTGLKWVTPASSGKVLQVVSSVITTATTIASTSFTDTGITASITPTSATSKILVMINGMVRFTRTVNAFAADRRIDRNGTVILTQGYDSFGIEFPGTGSILVADQLTNIYLDSPATTSALTYKLQANVYQTSSSLSSTWQLNSYPSVITLMEIGA